MDCMLLGSPLGRSPRIPVPGSDNEGARPPCRGIKSKDNLYHTRKAGWPCCLLWPALIFILSPVTAKWTWKSPTNANFYLMLCIQMRRRWLFCCLGVCCLALKKPEDSIIYRIAAFGKGAPDKNTLRNATNLWGQKKKLQGKELPWPFYSFQSAVPCCLSEC